MGNIKDDPMQYGAITTSKLARNLWQATTDVTAPLKITINMTGSTEENAILKLKLFLSEQPYKHIP